MKNFTQVDNSRDILRTLEGLKSRITPFLPLLATVLMLTFGGWNSEAWGAVPVYNGGTWYSLYKCDKEYNNENATLDVFSPNTGTLSFWWKKESSCCWGSYTGCDIYVKYSENGSSYSDENHVIADDIWTSAKGYQKKDVTVGKLIQKVMITQSGTRHRYFKDISIPLDWHVRLNDGSVYGTTSIADVDLGAALPNETSETSYHIDLRSFLMQYNNLRYVSSNPEFHFGAGVYDKTFAIKANACAYGDGDSGYDCTDAGKVGILGNPDSYEVDVYFTPSENYYGTRSTTITIYDGATARATITLNAKVVPTYYFKATSVATDGTSTLDIPVRASFTSGVYSGSTLTVSQTAATADVASLTKTAYFYAPASKDDYQFQGWYETAACNGERVSTDNTISFNITSNALSAETAVEKKYYAKYLEEIRAEFGGSDQVLMVDGGYDGISYSRTSEEHPTAAASAAEAAAAGKYFWYEIIIDEKTDVTTGSADDSKVIDFDPSTNRVTAINAGTARLILHQEVTGYYVEVDKEYTFTVNKHDPAFAWNTQTNYYYNTTVNNFLTKTSGASYTVTSSDEEVANMDGANLKIYNKAGTTKIKYVHPETYYWNEKKDSVTFTPGWKNNQLPITSLTSSNISTYEVSKSANYVDWFENTEDGHTQKGYRMGRGGAYNTSNEAIIGFTGIPDTMFFDVHIEKYAGFLPSDGERECKIYESPVNTPASYTLVGDYSEKTEWKDGLKARLKPTTRFVKFVYNGTIKCHYNNIVIQKREIFKTDSTSLDFATNIKNAACDAQTFKFHHASAGYITSVSSSDSHFTVSPTSVTTGGEVCDSAVITVTYSTAAVGEHSGTITISDNIGNSTSVSVTGTTVDAYTPTITWPGATSYLVGSTIANSFVAKDNNEDIISGTWSFESSDSTVIDVVEGELKAICGGTATITGTIAEGATWSSGSQTVSLTVTRNAASFTWSNVADDDKIHVWADSDIPSSIVSANTAINGLTSGNSDRLTVSGSKGSFSLHAGHKGEVTLTATSEGDCTYLNGTSSKTIVVEPCFQDIVWNQNFMGLMADENGDIDTTITLTAYAVDSSGVATNKTITYTLEDDDFASIDGNKLRITGTGTTTIYARTADDNKYAIAEASLSIRVRTYGEACNTYLAYDKDEHHVSTYTNNKGKVYSWDGPADSIWVKVGKQSSITTQSLHIYTYDKDGNETDWQDWGVGSLSSGGESKRLKLPEGTVKIKFQGGGTQYKWYSDLIVTQKRYFTADKSSIDRGVDSPVPVNMPFSETITVSYSDVPLIQYSYTGQYLTLTPLQTVENDCGNYGTYSFVLSGVFPKVGSHNEHIYFRTSAGDEIDIPVTIAVTTNGTFRFDQTAGGEWSESTNWTYGSETTHGMTPTIANDVIIEKNVTVVGEVSAYGVTIMPGATVTVAPTGGLTVGAGGVRYSTNNNLILQAGTEDPVKGKTGYLRISPHYTDTMPHAKVELYSIAYHNISSDESDDAKWQHVGIPVATDALAKTFFSKSWIYSYEESSDTWVNNRKTLVMEPFVGYATTQYKSDAGMLVTFPGQLVPNRGTKIIDLEYSGTSYGHNRIANSYAAPIDITQFRDTDFIRAEKTIYIYNTGSKNNSSLAKSATGNNAGQWTAVSIGTAAEMAERFAADPSLPKTIAPMQGFCVNAQAAGAKFKLNYNKLVWNADYTSHAPTALRAPKRNADAAEEEEMPITGSMKMTLEANGLTDNIYLLESERYMTDFEDGYDAHKMESGTLNIFTVENEDKLAIDATNSIIGTRVGVRTGEETAYTITFSYVDGEQEWALYDAETDEMIDITNDNTYTFFAEPNSNITERFMIVESNGAQIPAVTTGNDKVTSDVRAHKFIKDGELFILKNGVLYDVTGARVK